MQFFPEVPRTKLIEIMKAIKATQCVLSLFSSIYQVILHVHCGPTGVLHSRQRRVLFVLGRFSLQGLKKNTLKVKSNLITKYFIIE